MWGHPCNNRSLAKSGRATAQWSQSQQQIYNRMSEKKIIRVLQWSSQSPDLNLTVVPWAGLSKSYAWTAMDWSNGGKKSGPKFLYKDGQIQRDNHQFKWSLMNVVLHAIAYSISLLTSEVELYPIFPIQMFKHASVCYTFASSRLQSNKQTPLSFYIHSDLTRSHV